MKVSVYGAVVCLMFFTNSSRADLSTISSKLTSSINKTNAQVKKLRLFTESIDDPNVRQDSHDLISMIESELKEVDEKKLNLIRAGEQVELANNGLEAKNKELAEKFKQLEFEKDKADKRNTELANQEKLISMSFYASGLAALFVLFNIIMRFPTVRAEGKYINLQIQELKNKLSKK